MTSKFPLKTLGSIIDKSIGGGTPSKNISTYWSGKIPWISSKDFKDFYLYDSEDHITQEAIDDSSTNIVPRGCLLIVFRSSILIHSIPVGITMNEMAINQDVKALIFQKDILSQYVGYFINIFQTKILPLITKQSTTVQSINSEQFVNLSLPIPPKETQENIVAKMDNAYAAKKQKELEAQRLLESIDDYLLGELGIELPEPEENTIKNRIFIRNLREVSGDRFDSYYYKNIFELLKQSVLNGKYPINRLRDLSSDIQNGVEIRNYSNRGFRYLRVTDLGKYDINNNSPRYVDVTEIPSRIILNERCLLVSRSGSLGLISRVEPEIQNAILSSHIFKVELDINIIVPEYAEAFLRSKVGQLEIFRENNGGVIPEINQIALGKILIPFPPLEKQIEISEHITAIRNQAKQLQQQAKDDLEKAKQEVEAMILGDD
ncbi:restriction endonuclease subunit S [Microcystis aeruginosa]|uniref:restriction endonuclease subunit S n=1 Tax=Microcystis aeruginosa TaxID=1126 RepID=UPI0035D52528